MGNQRPWDVLLIGGASGVGKTQVSYRIARYAGVGITEIGDFQVILERMTSPDEYPEFHFWRRDPEAFLAMSGDEQLAFGIRYATIMGQALEYVIANHLRDAPPIVLERNFLLPSLAARESFDGESAAGRVRRLFLYEPKEAQIARTFRAGGGGPAGPGAAHRVDPGRGARVPMRWQGPTVDPGSDARVSMP